MKMRDQPLPFWLKLVLVVFSTSVHTWIYKASHFYLVIFERACKNTAKVSLALPTEGAMESAYVDINRMSL